MALTSPGSTAPLGWQRQAVLQAANYLRELILSGAGDARTKVVYEGLLDVLDPSRRAARQQRELASATKTAAQIVRQERRAGRDRRHRDRRLIDIGNQEGAERRSGADRRKGERRRR